LSQWQGSGLPPSALARIERARTSDLRFSQLSVGGQLAVESSALRPIGTVLGCSAQRLDWGEFGLGEVGCGYVSSRTLRSKHLQTTSYFPPSGVSPAGTNLSNILGLTVPGNLPLTSGDATTSADHVVYTDAAHSAWRAAIDRMLEESRTLGADGVVGVELSERRGKGEVREFVVTGTAVASTGASHLSRAFTTTLSGEDVAKLMAAGWLPASIVLGLSVAIRHDKLRARLARARLSSAREIRGISELAQAARQHARQQLRSRTQEIGADGAVLTSQVTLSIEERRIGWGHHDIVAEVRATASAIIEVSSGRQPRATPNRSVMPLRC